MASNYVSFTQQSQYLLGFGEKPIEIILISQLGEFRLCLLIVVAAYPLPLTCCFWRRSGRVLSRGLWWRCSSFWLGNSLISVSILGCWIVFIFFFYLTWDTEIPSITKWNLKIKKYPRMVYYTYVITLIFTCFCRSLLL